MPYSYPNNIPRPALNWNEDEQKKCIGAANAVLAGGGTEQTAIFACIRAAGKTEHPGGEGKAFNLYDAFADTYKEFVSWIKGKKEKPATKVGPENGFLTYKQADGTYRWFGWVSNHFKDKDTPPEIITGEAHKEYVAWADSQKSYPPLLLWHVPGTKVGQTDWLDFADGFLVASGTFDKAEVADNLAAMGDQTMSHGFRRRKAKMRGDTLYTDQYRMVEMSVTPKGAEVNPWTMFNPQMIKEALMLSKEKRGYLVNALGEEVVKAREEDTEGLKQFAIEAGVDWKAVEALEPKAEETPAAEDKSEAKAEKADADATVEALAERLTGRIVKAVGETFQIEGLNALLVDIKAKTDQIITMAEKINELEAEVKELKKSDDEKVSQVLAPKASEALVWSQHAASKQSETKVKATKADKELGEKTPFLDKVSAELATGLYEQAGIA